MNQRFRSAVFLQFMGTVGSGIFVLPYLFHKSNFIFASFFLIYLAVVTAALNHFYTEIVVATRGDHQLAGYAQIYLGEKFKLLTTINLILLAFGATVAYFKLFTSFFNLLFPGMTLLSQMVFLYLLFMLYLYRHKFDRNVFLFIPIFMLAIPVILYLISSFTISSPAISPAVPGFYFYGATLFALSGFTIIPEVREALGTNHKLSQSVLLGLIIAVISYFLYSYSVVKLSGTYLSIDSVSGLAHNYPFVSRLIATFGMIVTLRASFGFLMILHELFYRDLKINQQVSNFLPILFPILSLFLGSISLLSIISLTGHVTIYISAIIICLIRFKLPHSFSTQFFALLILISLTIGLWL